MKSAYGTLAAHDIVSKSWNIFYQESGHVHGVPENPRFEPRLNFLFLNKLKTFLSHFRDVNTIVFHSWKGIWNYPQFGVGACVNEIYCFSPHFIVCRWRMKKQFLKFSSSALQLIWKGRKIRRIWYIPTKRSREGWGLESVMATR